MSEQLIWREMNHAAFVESKLRTVGIQALHFELIAEIVTTKMMLYGLVPCYEPVAVNDGAYF